MEMAAVQHAIAKFTEHTPTANAMASIVQRASHESRHKAMADAVYLPEPDVRLPFYAPFNFVLPDVAFMAALEWLDLEETGCVNLDGQGLLTKQEAADALYWLHINSKDKFAREVAKFKHDLTWEELKLLWDRMGQAKRKFKPCEMRAHLRPIR
jgi:hypothetical protein